MAGVSKEAFLQDEPRQSAVLQKLMIIGESAARISAELREQHPEVEWRDIVAFRNFAIHAYFDVDWRIVWTTAILDVPSLREQITEIMAGL